ncbi:MAG: CHAT domain-containing protein [Cyanobacteria bacterium J06635_1]
MGFFVIRSVWQRWLTQRKLVWRRLGRRLIGFWMLVGLTVSWLLSCSLGTLAQDLPSEIVQSEVVQSEIVQPNGQALVQQGVDDYEQGRFSAAIRQWQQASEVFSQQGNGLAQAYVSNNLAQAYQQLAQWEAAQAALNESLAQLNGFAFNQLEDGPAQADYWEIWAKVLNTQGQLQWHQNQPDQALASWRQAGVYYQRAGAPSGAILAQLNQAQALQDLGLNGQALQLLQQTYQAAQSLDPTLKATSLRQLGIAFRQVGALLRSQQSLEESLATAVEPGPTLLEMGNTARALSHRAAATGQFKPAQAYGEETLGRYQSAAEQADSDLLWVQAQLNQLSYLIETGRFAETHRLWPALSEPLSALPLSRSALFGQLSYAHSLTCLAQPVAALVTTDCIRQEWLEDPAVQRGDGFAMPASASPFFEEIAQRLAAATQQAQQLRDIRLESYAVGQLGHLYELNQQWSEAEALTQKALSLIEGQQLPDITYRWEWQLGRIYRATGQPQALTTAAYGRAITALKGVRDDLLRVDAQVQFSFRDNVEPVYREFLEILLDPAANTAADPDTLKMAIQTLDALQLTELENFLGCNLSRLVKISETNFDPTAAKIYPIILKDRLMVIYDIPGQPLAQVETPVSQTDLETTVQALRQNLTLPGKTPAVLTHATQLYDWLMAPLDPVLAEQPQIQTLVFVPDGLLRNIPVGVLYDGERYLIERDYAIAVAPQIDLFQPSPSAELNIFRGGVDLPQEIRGTDFPVIEQVQEELDQIPTAFTSAPPLLNDAFTKSNIEAQLQTADFSAIHWKTHGVFSSDPSGTYLVAYQDSITANELNTLLQTLSQGDPLELMVLSACATAQGDRRAVLGLAGVAVRAGARSTLSTLWRADDDATTRLMSRFYAALLEPDMTKAKALQQAQLGLLREEGYPAPYYWGTYLLVGNWL